MASGGPWSVKGIDPKARETALEAARREGKTLGEWLNAIILDDDAPLTPGALAPVEPSAFSMDDDESLQDKLRRLSSRIDRIETGAGQGPDGRDALEELVTTHKTLAERIKALEEDGSNTDKGCMGAVKTLEDAVSTVAGHVHSRDERAKDRFQTVETRLERLTDKLEATSEELTQRLDRMSDSAIVEARRETDRLREDLKRGQEDEGERLKTLEETVSRLNDRLSEAEGLTTNAVRALEASFANLDDRIKKTESGETAPDDPRLDRLETALAKAQRAQTQTLTKLGQQVGLLGKSVERRLDGAERRMREEVSQERGMGARLREIEANSAQAVRRIGDEVAKISERLTERIEASEARNAENIQSLVDQVQTLGEGQKESAQRSLDDRLRESEERTRQMISEAMTGMGAKLDSVRDHGEQILSPVQQAMADMADRLEKLEQGDPEEAEAEVKPAAAPVLPSAAEALLAEEEPEEEAYYGEATAAVETRLNPFSAPEPARRAESESQNGLLAAHAPDGDGDEALFIDDTPASDDDMGAPYDGEGDLLFIDEEPPSGTIEADPSFSAADITLDDIDVIDEDAPVTPTEPPQLGATADPAFLNAARRSVQESQSDPADTPPTNATILADQSETTRPGVARIALLGAGALATLSLIGAAGVLLIMTPDAEPQLTAQTQAPALTVDDLLGDPEPEAAEPDPAETPSEPVMVADAATENTAVTKTPEPVVATEDPVSEPVQTAELTPPPAQPQPAPPQPSLDPVGDSIAALAPADQFQLGLAYLQSDELSEGLRLVRSAAEAGFAPAQYRLGKLFETGLGAPQDDYQALIWTERAAEAGNVKAMHNLGVMYAEGRGSDRNMAQAARWFESAALHGSADSQFNLAVLYEQGRGVTRSLADAYAWFRIAAGSGDTEAASRAEGLTGDLPEGAVREARLAADGFIPRPQDPLANGPWDSGEAALSGRAAIARAQALLANLGYNAGAADGVMGERTRQAIIQYQAREGLSQTGSVSPSLIERLELARAGG